MSDRAEKKEKVHLIRYDVNTQFILCWMVLNKLNQDFSMLLKLIIVKMVGFDLSMK